MKPYPSIAGDVRRDVPVHVFGKLDGSNVRVEVDRKRGLSQYGKRHGLLDASNPLLQREVPGLIAANYGEALLRALRDRRWEGLTAFFEFYGPNSFAGQHVEAEPHAVTLLDVSVHRRGFLEPAEILDLFGEQALPPLLHVGLFTPALEAQVEAGTLPGMPFEGVVCKGPWDRRAGRPLMFKRKSRAWIERLRERCGGDEALFQALL